MRFADKGLAMLRRAPSGHHHVNLFLPARRPIFFSPPLFLIKQWTSAATAAEDHAFKIPPPPPCATMIPVLFLLTASFAHAPRFALPHPRHRRAPIY